jgi:hypothetical protein
MLIDALGWMMLVIALLACAKDGWDDAGEVT